MISIIVPVYNTEKYLRRCIESIVNQSFREIELILVDDGSADSSPAICDEYADKDARINVIHKQNGGVVSARDEGIKVAKGEWLAFVDSDDWIHPDMLRKMIDASTERDIVWCDVCVVLENNSFHREISFNEQPEKMLKELLAGIVPGWLCNKIIRKDFWNSCNISLAENIRFMEDSVITAYLLNNFPNMAYVPQPFYYYNRCNDTAVTNSQNGEIMLKAKPALDELNNVFGKDKNYKKALARQIIRYKIILSNIENLPKAAGEFSEYNSLFKSYPLGIINNIIYYIAFNFGAPGRMIYNLYRFIKR